MVVVIVSVVTIIVIVIDVVVDVNRRQPGSFHSLSVPLMTSLNGKTLDTTGFFCLFVFVDGEERCITDIWHTYGKKKRVERKKEWQEDEREGEEIEKRYAKSKSKREVRKGGEI